jgi:hypothetical protein
MIDCVVCNDTGWWDGKVKKYCNCACGKQRFKNVISSRLKENSLWWNRPYAGDGLKHLDSYTFAIWPERF